MSNKSQETVIRTPDQRLRVFVSSTLQELIEERVGAREAITALRLSPVMFEMGARPHPPRDLYRAYLEQSDIFIGIYWQLYGWTAPDMEISGLEDEYRLSGDKPKLIYIKSAAPEREPRLKELLDRVQSDGVSYKPFSTAAELRGLIQDDLAMLLTERFDQGRAPRTSADGLSFRVADRSCDLPVQRHRGVDAAGLRTEVGLFRPPAGAARDPPRCVRQTPWQRDPGGR